MADTKPGSIQRNLEGAGNLYINRLWTGLYQNRSPLFTPVSAMGIQLIAKQDVLWDGQNMQLTPQFTLRRRYGFLKSCSTAFGSNEWPLTYFSFENLNGGITTLADTQSRVCIFTSGGLATLVMKATGAAQTSFNSVADTLYFCDGVDAYKYVGPNLLINSNAINTWTTQHATFTGSQTDPLGGTTAMYATFSLANMFSYCSESVTPNYTPVASNSFVFSVWMKANTGTPTIELLLQDQATNTVASATKTLSTSWVQYFITGTALSSATSLVASLINPSSISAQYFMWGAQLEIGTSPSTTTALLTASNITVSQPQGVYLWGIAAPVVSPTLSYTANGQLFPTVGYQYGYCFKNPLTGHISTMSPASASTGPLTNQTTVESSVTVNVTATAVTSNVVTVTCANNFKPGQVATISNLGVSTFLNGQTLTVVTASATQFTAAFTHANYSTVAETKGTAQMFVSIPTTPYQYTVLQAGTFLSDGGVMFSTTSIPLTLVASSPTTGQYSVAAGVYTFAAADVGKGIAITYSFSLVSSIGVNIVVNGDGSPDPQATIVQVYRTLDGGALFYLDAEISNPGGNSTWQYTDSTLDANLNNFIIAPVSEVNAPPPAGMSNITWYAGHLWGVSGNTWYFSAGPDATNGVGTECWPPGNNYALPGNGTAAAPTSEGLILFTKDDAYVVTGQSSANFTTPQIWQTNWGVRNQNNVTQDGDNLYLFTSKGQVYNWASSTGQSEIGFQEAQQLAAMNPDNVYVAIHRSGADEGCFICDGSAKVYRYAIPTSSWDTPIVPVGGIGAMMSMENSSGGWTLYMGRPSGSGYILQRDVNTWSDDGTAYPAWVTLGSLTLAPPRQIAMLQSVLLQAVGVGTYPTVSVMLNEITDTGTYPTAFTVLPNPVPDPPQLVASQSIWTKRHDLKAAQIPLPQHVQHLQVKVTFASEAQPNEILGFGFAHGTL